MLQDNNSNISTLLLDNLSEIPKTQAKSPKTQACRQLWLFMVAEYGRKNKPAIALQKLDLGENFPATKFSTNSVFHCISTLQFACRFSFYFPGRHMPTIFRMPHKAATIQLRQTRVNGINSQVYTVCSKNITYFYSFKFKIPEP